jgi:hypothetical protein
MPAVLLGSHPPKDLGLRPAYKVSELLALRESVSDDVVPLDKFNYEETIKGENKFLFNSSKRGLWLQADSLRTRSSPS